MVKSKMHFICWRLLFLSIFIGLPHVLSAAETGILIERDFRYQDIRPHVEMLRISTEAQLSDVKKSAEWEVSMDTSPLGEDTALWGRFTINNRITSIGSFSLVFTNPHVDRLMIFVLDDLGRIIETTLQGRNQYGPRAMTSRQQLQTIEIVPSEQRQIYFRLEDDGPVVFKLELWHQGEFFQHEQRHMAFVGMIAGALAVLCCYFLLTYTILRSPVRYWFSLSCLSLLFLYLNAEGLLGQFGGLGGFLAMISALFLGITAFCFAKVSHLMLPKIPSYWRYANYGTAIAMVGIAGITNHYLQIVLLSALGATCLVMQSGLSIAFRYRYNSMPNRIYALGWICISAVILVVTSLYLTGITLTSTGSLLYQVFVLFGVLLIALAVEVYEEVLTRRVSDQQQDTIDDLRRFYTFFQNSAEGLYTSNTEGKLVTTNPAMCEMFGYESEAQMLAEIRSTSQFYANEGDRELLIGQLLKENTAHGREIKGMRRDGSEFWFSISAQLREEGGQKLIFGSIIDITERKQSDISLEYMASHDPLTGVYNRREFEKRLRKDMQSAQEGGAELTMLYLDLDQFKVVNDTCGHKAGDVLIKDLSNQMRDVVGERGILARLGGDEFGVLLNGEQAGLAYIIANQLLNKVKEFRFIWENRIFTVGVSIGLAKYNEQIQTPEQLLSTADAACYLAKEQGRNQIHTHSAEDEHMKRYESELYWVSHINQALEKDRFVLFYQHYHALTKLDKGYNYEILVRMLGEDDEIVPPSAFLPAAERYNLSAKLDMWVVQHTFRWLADNPDHLRQLKRCSINLSGHSLADKGLKLFVLNAFEKYGIPYRKICFEITESMAIVKMTETLEFMRTFKQLGCLFALDDFGSGFSSYGYLKNLPVAFVKIDGGFVKDMLNDPIDFAMVSSINDVAKAMKIRTVAEFVESPEVMTELGKLGVDYAQGYGIARPHPLTDFAPYDEQLLKS